MPLETIQADLLARIQEEEIDLERLLSLPGETDSGAVVLFCGRVRAEHSKAGSGKRVVHLEYEAHSTLAQKCMQKILEECALEEKLYSCGCIHRIGRLLPGQTAVAILTASTHRPGAYSANRRIIERVKAEVPLWKKEVYEDGSYDWGQHAAQIDGIEPGPSTHKLSLPTGH